MTPPLALALRDEVVPPEAVTPDLLFTVFIDAYVEVDMDKEGDLAVREHGLLAWIQLVPEPPHIRYYAYIRYRGEPGEPALLEYVNDVNRDFPLRATVMDDADAICFEGFCYFAGGITRRSLVLHARRFLSVAREAIRAGEGSIFP
jgi:hypothetical protein